MNRVVEQPGTIEAYEVAQRYARVPGYVRLPYDAEGQLLIDIGHAVRGPKYDASGKELEPGQILAEVDVPELRTPCVPELKWVLRKAILPAEEELKENPRSRSAQLRVLEKM